MGKKTAWCILVLLFCLMAFHACGEGSGLFLFRLRPAVEEAPWEKQYGYFTALDQSVTVFPMDEVTEMAWFRPAAQ